MAGLNADQARELRLFKSEIFRVLAHPTRVHIVETLKSGELSVGAILEQVGVEPANLSQHLSILRARRLVTTRKEGNLVFYSLRDPLLTEVLEAMRQYFLKYLGESLTMLHSMEATP